MTQSNRERAEAAIKWWKSAFVVDRRMELTDIHSVTIEALEAFKDSGWNFNMDEAPKDGTRILLLTEENEVREGFRPQMNFEVDFWQLFNARTYTPTAWQPLPTPPSKGDRELS